MKIHFGSADAFVLVFDTTLMFVVSYTHTHLWKPNHAKISNYLVLNLGGRKYNSSSVGKKNSSRVLEPKVVRLYPKVVRFSQ